MAHRLPLVLLAVKRESIPLQTLLDAAAKRAEAGSLGMTGLVNRAEALRTG